MYICGLNLVILWFEFRNIGLVLEMKYFHISSHFLNYFNYFYKNLCFEYFVTEIIPCYYFFKYR